MTAIARVADTLFVGGAFDRVVEPAPGFALLTASTGAPRGGANVGVVASLVAAVPGGGWIVAGDITGAGATRRRLARLDASGAIDASWNVDYDVNGSVSFLAVQGSAVLLGGVLRSVNGVARTSLAAVDLTTGSVLPWNPKLASAFGHPIVARALLHQGRVFVQGQFDQVNNQAVPSGFAAIDATSGALLATPAPPGVSSITSWAAAGDNLYVLAGTPAATAGQRLSILSGTWNAWLPAGVSATAGIVATPTAVFGVSAAGTALLDLDPVSAATRSQPFVATGLDALTGGASRLLLMRNGYRELIALPTATPTVVSWRAPITGTVPLGYSNPTPRPILAAENGGVTAVSGLFAAVGGDPRPGLLAIDLASGQPTAFAPAFSGTVNALVAIGGILVVGGDLVVGGQATGALALDAASGQILSWRPPFSGKVTAMAVDARALHFAGDVGLASLSLATLAVTSRQPFNGVVRDLTVAGDVLVAGGDFTTADGVVRNGAAAFAGTPLTLTPWDPAARYVFNPTTNASVPGTVSAVATAGGRIAVSGLFTHLGATTAPGFGVFDASGARVPFGLPAPYNRSNDVATDGSRFLVAARRFVDLSPEPFIADGLVLQSASTGQVSAWSPTFTALSTPVRLSTVALYPDAAVVAGEFSVAGGRRALNLAIFPIAPRGAGTVTRLIAQVSGSTLSLGWSAPTGTVPPSYRIDATQNGVPLGSFALATSGVVAPLPAGIYSLIVRANGAVGGVPTDPIVLTVPAPANAPAVPLNLTGDAAGFAWDPGTGGGNVESFVIEAGTQSGLVNIGVIDTGVADTSFAVPIPPGTYFVRVRAKNAFGLSAPSNEVAVVVTP